MHDDRHDDGDDGRHDGGDDIAAAIGNAEAAERAAEAHRAEGAEVFAAECDALARRERTRAGALYFEGDGDPDEIRATIRDHAARALYVCAFADACEWADDDDPDGPGADPEFRAAYGDHPDAAGAGADWMDTTAHHDTPREAIECADRIVAEFEAANGWPIVDAFRAWLTFDHRYTRTDPDAEKFGHYLAMQSMGHGVGLWDDIADGPCYDRRDAFGFVVGHAGEHFGAWDFDAPPRDDH